MSNKYFTKEEIDEKFMKRGKPHIHALSDSHGDRENIYFHCEIHDYTWKAQLSSTLYKQFSCRKCGIEHSLKLKYKNENLFNTNPEVAKCLENPEDAKYCTLHSRKKLNFICPQCGTRLYKSVANVSLNGLNCNICSDGFSYPNKFMFDLLSQLNVDFEPEFSPQWISPRRYDFYFIADNKQYIIEMDGGLGHGKKVFGNKGSVEQTLINDFEKDQLALWHGIQVIRINSDKSEMEVLKQNIICSELSQILDLSTIDWEHCNMKASGSRLLKVCECYKRYPFLSYKKLSSIFNIHRSTLSRYLAIGYQQGLCPKYRHSRGKPILCTTSQRIFATCSDAARFYQLDSKSIWLVCNHKREHVHTLHFIYLDEYEEDIMLLHPIDIVPQVTSNKRKVNLYDKEYRYIKTYDSIADAVRDNNSTYRVILKSIHSPHKFNFGKTYYYADDPNQPDLTKIIAS